MKTKKFRLPRKSKKDLKKSLTSDLGEKLPKWFYSCFIGAHTN